MKLVIVAAMLFSSVAMANWDLYERVRFHNFSVEDTYGCRHIADEYHVFTKVISEDGERSYDVQVSPEACKKILKNGMKLREMEGAKKVSENKAYDDVYVIDMIEISTDVDMGKIIRM